MGWRLREVTWVRLLALLLWTLLMMINRGITPIIEGIEDYVFVTSETKLREDDRKEKLIGTLFPQLDDELVMRQIWPRLHKRVNVSLMWRMRRVSRAWKREIEKTIEWAALEIVRLDAPGYLLLLAERTERRPSMQERVEAELRALRILLSECLESVAVRSSEMQSGIVIQKSVRRDKRPHWTEQLAKRAESEAWRDCMCEREWVPYQEISSDNSEIEFICSDEEEEESETYASSTDSSLQVCYPRHEVRFR